MTAAREEEPPSRQRLAAEALELGEALFDAVVEAFSTPQSGDDAAPFPLDEVRAAQAEFFATMRVLLGLDEAP